MKHFLWVLGFDAVLICAQPQQQIDLPIDAKTRSAVIDGVLDRLNRAYVFPDVAGKMATAVKERQGKGEYDGINSSAAFAQTLTEHLRAVSHDKHLRVNYFHDPPPDRPLEDNPESARKQMAFNNFGFEKVERLPGNIGYIDLRGFMNAEFAKETGAAAMNLVANSDALIIDLRNNGGGDPAMVAFVTSYLYGPEPVHLNDLYWRPSNETQEWWTLRSVPGKRMPKTDVYVITSRRTFSAAEEFTYNLKNLKRATIVGEQTGGGAHPGGPQRVNEHFAVWVPSGRAINPISKTNWEGEGVKPDVEAPAEKALTTAHLLALKKVTGRTSDPMLKQRFERVMGDLEKELK